VALVELRAGVTRRVLLVGPAHWGLVVKVPRCDRQGTDGTRGRLWSFTRGVQANLSEMEWSGFDPGFNPVLWGGLGGLITVQRRLAPATREPNYRGLVQSMVFRGDGKLTNVGVPRDGRTVWVDYDWSWNACPHHPGDSRCVAEADDNDD